MSDEVLEIEETKVEDIIVLRIKGRLDVTSSPQSEKTIFDLINKGAHKILLDFSQVDYISSAGMRMLLSSSKKLKSLSGKLILCQVTAGVMDVLKMSGFDHVLELSKTEEDALRKFK
jgi:anti-sigma B factor antagonist/stage II sporulation protein AA (anti-sigma F factor antagonist)